MSFLHHSSTTTKTTTTSTTTKSSPSDRLFALCTGINDYPGTQNDLRGCVNDAKDWQDLLKNTYGFKIYSLLDSACKVQTFTETLGGLISDSRPNDHIVLTYSGHGSNVPDTNGDEADGRDEAMCLYDGFLIDDSIRGIIQKLNPEARLTIISDSCFSGTVTRAFLTAMDGEDQPKPRYLPPTDMEDVRALCVNNITSKIFYPESDMKEVLISGCSDTEYSYDAYLGNTNRGAFSYYATRVLRTTPQITYNDFYAKLKQSLPSSSYPQSPQLEGSDTNKARIMFS